MPDECPTPSMTRWITRYQRRVHVGLFLKQLGDWFAGGLLFLGTIILAVKLTAPLLWPHILWGTALLAIIAGAAWLLAWRSRFTHRESVALLDNKLNAGGLLMTLSEASSDEWVTHLPNLEKNANAYLPKYRPKRFLKRIGLPLLFAVAACMIPLREAQTTPLIPNHVGRQASDQLDEMLTLLEEAAVVEEEEEEEIREQIKKLAEETEHTPLTHEKWETIDTLRERMTLRLNSGALQVAKAQAAVQTLATGNDGNLVLSSEQAAELSQDVLEALQSMTDNGGLSGASEGLRSELQRLLKNGEFRLPSDRAARQRLLSDLEDFLSQESERLSELRQSCTGACRNCGEFHPGGT